MFSSPGTSRSQDSTNLLIIVSVNVDESLLPGFTRTDLCSHRSHIVTEKMDRLVSEVFSSPVSGSPVIANSHPQQKKKNCSLLCS